MAEDGAAGVRVGRCAGDGVDGGQQAADVGIVSNVKVLSDKNPDDMSSAETWKKAYIKEGMSDQEKALAIWRTVTKYRHQDNPPNEGMEGDPDKDNGNVHEPFKTFNVYGYGMCCCAAADIEGLARYVGLPARGRIINLHSVPEVWYSNSWHLLDSSLMFYLIKPDGLVASVDEMKADIAAWRKLHPELKNETDLKNFAKDEGWKKNGPPLFAACQFYDKDGINRAGWHGWWSNMGEYNYKLAGNHKIVVPPDTNGEVNVYDYGRHHGLPGERGIARGRKADALLVRRAGRDRHQSQQCQTLREVFGGGHERPGIAAGIWRSVPRTHRQRDAGI